jgi:AcrR family transcriptional regulator
MARVGRRPGEALTRQAIIEAAHTVFLEQGYAATTIRAVARLAEVDPALIYHYFDDKPALFVATLQLPADPRRVKEESSRGGFKGTKLVERFLASWETDPQRPGQSFVTVAQAMSASPEVARCVREFLAERVWSDSPVEADPETQQRIHALICTQLMGTAWARYILRIEPLASASRQEVAVMVGPVIDRLMACATQSPAVSRASARPPTP